MRRVLILSLLLMGLTFYADEGFTRDGAQFNVTVGSGGTALIMTQEYYTVLIREGSCQSRDIYSFCLDGIDYDPVEHYPHEYKVNMTVTKLCDECRAYGQTCTTRQQCDVACVNGTCRPSDPWCGDGFCGEDEVCAADCPNQTVPHVSAQAPGAEPEQPATQPSSPAPAPSEPAAQPPAENTSTPAAMAAEESPEPEEFRVGEREANWLGAAGTVILGVVGIVFVFGRKKKTKIKI